MRKIAWTAPVVAGLTVGVPLAANAATVPAPPTSTGVTSTAQSAPATAQSAPATAQSAPATAQSAPATAQAEVAPSSQPAAPAPTTSTSTTHAASTSTTSTHSASTPAQSTTVTSPAPPGTAQAYALQIGNYVALSHTKATASGSGTSSTADPVELGGTPPSSHFGGTQTGPGTSTGNLIDTGAGQPFRLRVMPWTASNTQSSTGSSASGVADIIALDLGTPGTAQSASVRVLRSQSNASWTPAASSGSSSSDGAIINAGGPNGLNIDLLHSQTSSSGAGSSYLLSINGNQIGSSQQANGKCAISIPSLLALNCLTASGGTSNGLTSGNAAVLTSILGSGASSLPVNGFTSSSSSGAASPSVLVPPSVGAGSSGLPSSGPSSAGSAPSSGAASAVAPRIAAASNTSATGQLAFTGIDLLGLVAAAMTLSAAGGLVVVSSRRKLRTGSI